MFKVIISEWFVLVLFVIDTRLATEANLARGQLTSQSSTKYGALSNRAVDGNRDSSWEHDSCTHTVEDQRNPWWTVDLGQPTNVGKVVFYNRQGCCGERANGFIVGLTNASTVAQSPTVGRYALCGQHVGTAGAVETVFCSVLSPAARYVIVQLNRIGTLTICELEVYEDINECTLNISNCEQICTNTPGTYNCSCRSGFTLNADGYTCNDTDECKLNISNCEHFCTNTRGGYNCSCRSGYTLNTDGHACDDIDECLDNNGNCSQTCTNTTGSYYCSCRSGYTLNTDNRTCDDIDECRTRSNCSQMCNNTPGSYKCSCVKGFQLGVDDMSCDDIDECNTTIGIFCSQLCNNSFGSYKCSCRKGYQLNADGKACDDVNECNTTNGNCSQLCNNTLSSYNCSCRKGYQLNVDGKACDDINECNTTNGNCSQVCDNTMGGYNCYCRNGYQLNTDGRTCAQAPSSSRLAALVLLILIVPVIVVLLIVIRRRRKNVPKDENNKSHVLARSISTVGDRSKVTSMFPVEENVQSMDVDLSPIYEDLGTEEKGSTTTRVKVVDLPELVARINRMPNLRQAEFKSIPLTTDASCSFAQKPELKQKNRFKNILPYDKNRTELAEIGGNPLASYVNASFIRGYSHGEMLIAAQGPTIATLDDFWRLIWEYNVGVIVMLTKCHEEGKKKCEQYWPETCEMDFGTVRVTPSSLEERPGCIMRKLKVSKNDENRLVTQLQLMDWPDHGVPEHAISLLAMRRVVKRLYKPGQYTLIHCSAGVGRTGTYLAVNYLLAQAANEKAVDIHECVKDLREQRMHSVQTQDQYSFIFKALLEGLILGETTQPLTHLQNYIKKLRDINPLTKKSILATEFQMLEQMAPTPQQAECSDALSEVNKNKNRLDNIVPLNNRRVIIQRPTKGRTDYINAVYVPSFQRQNAYISTHLPLPDTVSDFWRMCVDCGCKVIVFICIPKHSEELYSFLPTPDSSLQFGSISVRLLPPVATKENENIELIKVVATCSDRQQPENVYENTQNAQSGDAGDHVTIVQVILSENRGEVRATLSRVHDVVENLGSTVPSAEPGPIVVMSRDGVQHCGQFIAVSNLLDMIKSQQEVDVFQTVYHVKKSQPHFFAKLSEYEEMYKFAEANAEQTSIYYNT